MMVVGRTFLPRAVVIDAYVWSGRDAEEVHCGAPAEVWVGFYACVEHGASYFASELRREIERETGVRLPLAADTGLVRIIPPEKVVVRKGDKAKGGCE